MQKNLLKYKGWFSVESVLYFSDFLRITYIDLVWKRLHMLVKKKPIS